MAKSYVLKGKARIEMGEFDKGKKDIEKAVDFLLRIAHIKYEKIKFDDCYKFCERAVKIGKENVVKFHLISKVQKLKLDLNYDIETEVSRPKPAQRTRFVKEFLSISQDFYNLKGKDIGQYILCYETLESHVIGTNWVEENDLRQALILQGKALRRLWMVDEAFEEKPWCKYKDSNAQDFSNMEEYKLASKDLPNKENVFKMMDVNGIELINVHDMSPMLDIILVGIVKRLKVGWPCGWKLNTDTGWPEETENHH